MNLIHTGLRALQFLWILLITALIGNVIASAFAGNPSVINYSIFVAVFCWIVLIYGLLAAFMESLFIPVVLLAMDGLALLFTLCAGIALAAELGVHSCSNKVCIPATTFQTTSIADTCLSRAIFYLISSPMVLSTKENAAMNSRRAVHSSGFYSQLSVPRLP